MVIYDSGDSSNLITALEANLSGAQQIFNRLSKGSQHLIGVIDSGTLSGAAYKAGQTLFVAYINPMLQKLNQAIADIQGDLKSYQSANSAISAVGNRLDSNQIQELLNLTQNMIDLVEQKIKDDRDFINQFFSGGFEKVGNALAELPDLYDQLENLKELKATRQKELEALETFSSSTNSLFQDSLRAFENAMKGVDVINRSTASADGTIIFPAGADMSWATKLSAEKFSSSLSGAKSKKKTDKIEIKWSAMNGMGESFATVYVNGKVDNEKTKDLRWAINKMGWANLKKLAPELIVELIGVNDVKTLLDTDASFSKQSLSFLSLLLTYFPLKKAVSLYKAMEAARLLEKGGDLALDLAKISKTFGLTEKEAKVLSEVWDAEKRVKKSNSLDKKLMEELAEKGVKHNSDDVVMITKDSKGNLDWLETGNEKAGLNHILKEHEQDFLNKGISKEEIPDIIEKAIQDGKIIGYQARGTGRPIYEVVYNGKTFKIGITMGDNGFIVGANPK